MTSKPYKVGYGKPPVHSQFKPGQSGNRKGRAKESRNLATDLSEELAEKLTITQDGKPRKVTKQRAVLMALVAKSLKGDARAATALLRLIPDAERVKAANAEAQTLSATDHDILQAFREQIQEELSTQKKDRSHER